MKNYLMLLIFSFFLLSCGKEISSSAPEYIGFWEGKDENGAYTIRIDENNYGRYSFVGSGTMDSAEGNAKIEGNKLIINLRRLTIDTPPFEENNTWKMTVNGVNFRLLTK